MQDYIQINDDFSFDKIVQQIVDEITKQQEDFTEQYLALEKTNNDLQSGNLFYLLVILLYLINNLIRID